MFAALILALATVEGDWFGLLEFGVQKLRIAFHVTTTADGKLSATAESPDQSAAKFPVGSVKVDQDQLVIEMPKLGASFSGKLAASGEQIDGTFKQGGATVPLVLRRTAIRPVRPQVPSKPYPYDELDVSFDSAAGVKLAGSLTTPRGQGPFPALLLITGSGPQTRDCEVAGHPIFLVMAHHFTQKGFAVLRYDDRGTGKSTGDFVKATIADFAIDAAAAVDFLKAQPTVAAAKIGLLGHSEGAVVAPMTVSTRNDIAFLVLLAPSAVNGRELILAQKAAILKASGIEIPDLKADLAVYDALLAKQSDAAVREAAKPLLAGMPEAAQASQLRLLTSPWFRHFLMYDPAPVFAKLKLPTLALFGGKDLQVLASQNAPPLQASAAKNVTIETMPGLNHLFQTAKTGSPSEYGSIEETISPAVLKRISAWITTQLDR